MSEHRKQVIMSITAVILVNLFLIALVSYANAELYKKGSSGGSVTEIQTRLKSWGYYDGEIDGIYGSRTERAVRSFQQKNGLSVDGQVGAETLAALGIAEQGGSQGTESVDEDLYLLARLISAEARGEPYIGQVAVGAVVLNRINHASFPNSLADVIYQKEAFTCVADGQFNEPIAESAYRAAQEALNGNDPSGGAIYYYNPRTATSQWIFSRPVITQIGAHVFCS